MHYHAPLKQPLGRWKTANVLACFGLCACRVEWGWWVASGCVGGWGGGRGRGCHPLPHAGAGLAASNTLLIICQVGLAAS